MEGYTFSADTFDNMPDFKQGDFRRKLYLFLQDWFSDSPTLTVHTSGSTGQPTELEVEKERMMQSAALTCSFLELTKGNKALLCLPLDYIAGKMMVVRALVAGLDLYAIEPCGNPMKGIDTSFRFAAMIPLQVYNSLQDEVETKRLSEIENLIIGGGAVDKQIVDSIKDFPNKVYSTYGMTETLSHIALRKLNGTDASEYYTPFHSVALNTDEDNALIIDAPLVSARTLYTNDIVDLREGNTFRIIGRKDNIINSGGIKIQAEEVEDLLRPHISVPFAISSLPDSKFGEIIVLAINGAADDLHINIILPSYFRPRKIVQTDIPLTETGKIARAKLKDILKNREI